MDNIRYECNAGTYAYICANPMSVYIITTDKKWKKGKGWKKMKKQHSQVKKQHPQVKKQHSQVTCVYAGELGGEGVGSVSGFRVDGRVLSGLAWGLGVGCVR